MNKEEMNFAQRSSTCPSCHADVPNEPSPSEYAEMMDEARLRMLKAEQVKPLVSSPKIKTSYFEARERRQTYWPLSFMAPDSTCG